MTHMTVGGHLKIYLGYAPGVGKTYQMLEDARALKARGVDLVIGVVDAHGRNDIREHLEGLKTVPLARVVQPGRRRRRVGRRCGACAGVRECAWWTSWPTPTHPVQSDKSAGKTFRYCSMRASMFSPP